MMLLNKGLKLPFEGSRSFTFSNEVIDSHILIQIINGSMENDAVYLDFTLDKATKLIKNPIITLKI